MLPSFDLIPLLVQTGYAGLFVFMLFYVLRDVKQTREAWEKERLSWTMERKERHDEFIRIHEEHLKMQRETVQAVNGLRLVMQQWFDQPKPPFTGEWNGEERRKSPRRQRDSD